jgi:di/tricarboxylate transporter
VSIHLISILTLGLIFVLGTTRPVNIGAMALVAVFMIGTLIAGESVSEILSGFPPQLFVLLVGVTYLFGLASVNGTIAWLIGRAANLLGNRPAMVPWLVFFAAVIPSAAGAMGPATVALLAPLAFELGERYQLDRRMIALMVMHGSGFGNFSPLNGLAIIVRQAAELNGLQISAAGLFAGNAIYNLGLGVVIYLMFEGRRFLRGGVGAVAPVPAPPVASAVPEALRVDQILTLLVILAVGIGALVFNIEIGFLALIAAVGLHLLFPKRMETADKRIVWSIVLLICGVVTYMAALERYGTIDVVGSGIANLGSPLLTAFLLCLVAAAISAFASSSGLLGVMVPLAVPFLALGQVGATGMIVALAVCATTVDAVPFSSVGALITASSPEEGRQRIFRAMLMWGLAMVATTPIFAWLLFILPSSL